MFLITNQCRTKEASQAADLPVCNSWKKSETLSTPMVSKYGWNHHLGTCCKCQGSSPTPHLLCWNSQWDPQISILRSSPGVLTHGPVWEELIQLRALSSQQSNGSLEGKISFSRINFCNNWTKKRWQIYHFLALCHYFASLSYGFLTVKWDDY